jgi:CDP-diacylglycerol---glycerol-3-phosphate 3-phosphatidyltransferase
MAWPAWLPAFLFMNLPNRLTVARMVLTVVFVFVASSSATHAFTIAMLIFGLASFTDYLDGRIARERNLITAFGKLMDPLADKVLMTAAFIVLLDADRSAMPAWLVIAVLTREFLVTGLRLIASSQGAILAADRLGKQKTIWQIVTACYLLVRLASAEPAMAWARPLFTTPWIGEQTVIPILLAITLGTTLWSGAVYFWKNRSLIAHDL